MAFIEELMQGMLPLGPVGSSNRIFVKRATATTSPLEPASVSQLKDKLRMPQSNTQKDEDLKRAISSARYLLEAKTRQCFIASQWIEVRDNVLREFTVCRRPLASVQSIQYMPNMNDDTLLTFASTGYAVSGSGRIIARSAWPTHRGWQSFIVNYTSGMTDKPAELPTDIVNAVLITAAAMYENPEGGSSQSLVTLTERYGEIPPQAAQLIERYIKWL